MADGRHFEKN